MRGRLRAWLRRNVSYRWARRIVVAVIGGTLLLIGIAMVVLPGPAIVFVPIGLGVLGLEFAWARHWLRKLRVTASDVVSRVRWWQKEPPPEASPPPPPSAPGAVPPPRGPRPRP